MSTAPLPPTKCLACRGEHQQGALKDRVFEEPDPRFPGGAVLRGWICDECALVHWAWEVS